jgi:CRISPR/Cas system-associated exonuclease Cas4 (RecB family)
VPFQLRLAHPVDCHVLDVPLVGALDAVVVEGERPVVLELKTSKKKWSNDQLEFDLQTSTYGIAARELGHRDAKLRLLVTTKTKKPVVQNEVVERMRGDEDELAEVVIGVHRAIKAGVDFPVRGWQCRSCPFAGACRP